MKLRGIACLLFLLNTTLFATYYSVSKEAMERIDPIVFSFFEMALLVPVAVCILIWTWQDVNRAVIKHGVILGSWLCLSFFTIAIALKYTTATSTAFFPSLNGLLAAFIAWFMLRQPIKKSTWVAGVISVIGTALLISVSSIGGWRGTLIAFLGGVFFTFYVFLADHEQKDAGNPWSLFAVETLTMAVCATFIALLFGNWQAVHPQLPRDGLVLVYIAGATTFLPILITVTMQNYISPVTVSFIYILEPVLGAICANLYLHESLPPLGYVGGGLVFVGAIIHTTGMALPDRARSKKQKTHSAHPSVTPVQRHQDRTPFYVKPVAILLVFLLFLGAEFALLNSLGGFPPRAWLDLYAQWPQLSTMMQNGDTTYVVLLWVQAICWLVVWLASILMALLIVSYLAGKVQPAQDEQELALRHYFSREDTMVMPVIQPVQPVQTIQRTRPARSNQARQTSRTTEDLPTRPNRYPVRPPIPVEDTRERVLVEEFMREYL